MSATRDKSQKIGFINTNLYQIYRKEKETSSQSSGQSPAGEAAPGDSKDTPSQKKPEPSIEFDSGRVIKAKDLHEPSFGFSNSSNPKIREFNPASLIRNRIEKPEALRKSQVESQAEAQANHDLQKLLQTPGRAQEQNVALGSLKDNLKTLQQLHSRLRFMLKELEDLVKE